MKIAEKTEFNTLWIATKQINILKMINEFREMQLLYEFEISKKQIENCK